MILANLLDARRRDRWLEGLAPVGWAFVVAGGLAMGGGSALHLGMLKTGGGGAIVLGLIMVLLFSESFSPPLKRLLGGLHGVTEVTRAFGDVLSYLRWACITRLNTRPARTPVNASHIPSRARTHVWRY